MREIILKVVPGEGGAVNYRQTLLDIARQHPSGITVDEMKKAVRIYDQIRQSNGVLHLEEADWEALVSYIRAYPFIVADERLLVFFDEIEKAPQIPI